MLAFATTIEPMWEIKKTIRKTNKKTYKKTNVIYDDDSDTDDELELEHIDRIRTVFTDYDLDVVYPTDEILYLDEINEMREEQYRRENDALDRFIASTLRVSDHRLNHNRLLTQLMIEQRAREEQIRLDAEKKRMEKKRMGDMINLVSQYLDEIQSTKIIMHMSEKELEDTYNTLVEKNWIEMKIENDKKMEEIRLKDAEIFNKEWEKKNINKYKHIASSGTYKKFCPTPNECNRFLCPLIHSALDMTLENVEPCHHGLSCYNTRHFANGVYFTTPFHKTCHHLHPNETLVSLQIRIFPTVVDDSTCVRVCTMYRTGCANSRCNNLHTRDEISRYFEKCSFMESCKKVKCVGVGLYANTGLVDVCLFRHIQEDTKNFLIRIGLDVDQKPLQLSNFKVQKMCVNFNECKSGDCRYMHTFEDIQKSGLHCVFKGKCRGVICKGNGLYLNVVGMPRCMFRHEWESSISVANRIGMKVPTPTVPTRVIASTVPTVPTPTRVIASTPTVPTRVIASTPSVPTPSRVISTRTWAPIARIETPVSTPTRVIASTPSVPTRVIAPTPSVPTRVIASTPSVPTRVIAPTPSVPTRVISTRTWAPIVPIARIETPVSTSAPIVSAPIGRRPPLPHRRREGAPDPFETLSVPPLSVPPLSVPPLSVRKNVHRICMEIPTFVEIEETVVPPTGPHSEWATVGSKKEKRPTRVEYYLKVCSYGVNCVNEKCLFLHTISEAKTRFSCFHRNKCVHPNCKFYHDSDYQLK
jgi:hypothetical protein